MFLWPVSPKGDVVDWFAEPMTRAGRCRHFGSPRFNASEGGPGTSAYLFGGGERLVMTIYYLIIGVILILGSVCMIAWPRAFWFATRGWRYANPEEVRLSAAHKTWMCISGAVAIVMGVFLIIYTFR
jgi:hypothetical protein